MSKKSITVHISEKGAFEVSFSPSWHDLRPKDIDRSLKFMHRSWKQARANELIKKRKVADEAKRKEAEEEERIAALEAKEKQEQAEKEAAEEAKKLKRQQQQQHKSSTDSEG